MYYQNYYKLISIDLSRQKNACIPEKIIFTGKLEKYDSATIIFVVEMQQKIIINFSLDSLIVTK